MTHVILHVKVPWAGACRRTWKFTSCSMAASGDRGTLSQHQGACRTRPDPEALVRQANVMAGWRSSRDVGDAIRAFG